MSKGRYFSFGEAYDEGWRIAWGPGASASVLAIFFLYLIYSILELIGDAADSLIFSLLALLVIIVGYAFILPSIVRRMAEHILPREYFAQFPQLDADAYIGRLVVAYLVITPLFVIGLILFIIPGFIVNALFFFADIIIIIEGVRAFEGLDRSMKMGRGYRLEIFFAVSILTSLGMALDWVICEIFEASGLLQVIFLTIERTIIGLWIFGVAVSAYAMLRAPEMQPKKPSESSDDLLTT